MAKHEGVGEFYAMSLQLNFAMLGHLHLPRVSWLYKFLRSIHRGRS
jgi:hypothetical protein